MNKVTKINHIGIVVPDIEKSLKFWQDILGIQLDYTENVPSMDLELAWLPVGKTRIELLKPTSEVGNEYHDFLSTCGPGVHHICFEVEDITEMVHRLKENHIHLKNDEPVELPGRKVVFLDPLDADGVIVELYELT